MEKAASAARRTWRVASIEASSSSPSITAARIFECSSQSCLGGRAPFAGGPQAGGRGGGGAAGEAGGEALERRAHLDEVTRDFRRDLGDRCAAPRLHVHEAFGGERAQRLADTDA